MTAYITRTRCDLCGESEASPYLTVQGAPLVRCAQCGFIYCAYILDRRATEDAVYTESHDHDYSASISPSQIASVRRKRRQISELLSVSKGRILDVGCGKGYFLNQFSELGWEAHGVEMNEATAEYARRTYGITVSARTFEEARFPENFFDAVTMLQVIEHIPDPVAFLRQVRRTLKPGGLLFMETPNIESLQARWMGEHWNYLCPWDHIHFFSPQTLRSLAGQSGYRVRRIHTSETSADTFYTPLFYLKNLLVQATRMRHTKQAADPPDPQAIVEALQPKHSPLRLIAKPILDYLVYAVTPLHKPYEWLLARSGKGACLEIYAMKEPVAA
jgi:2-polyprenyl-3-methyl-5-hydroxy-6-metoxy-1,4-benzoquinol methylase